MSKCFGEDRMEIEFLGPRGITVAYNNRNPVPLFLEEPDGLHRYLGVLCDGLFYGRLAMLEYLGGEVRWAIFL